MLPPGCPSHARPAPSSILRPPSPGFPVFVKNSVWLAIDRLTRIGLGFVVGVALIRHLGPERYGVYAYVMAVAMLLAPVAKFGFEQLAVRLFISTGEAAGAVARQVLAVRLALGVMCAAAMVGGMALLAPDVPRGAVWAAAAYLVVQALETADLWLQSRSRLYLGGAGRTAAQLIVAATTVVLITLDAPLAAFLATWVAEGLIASLWSLAMVLKTDGRAVLAPDPSPSTRRFDLRENASLVLTAFIIVLYFRVDALVLPHLLGPALAGRYLAALPVLDALAFFGSILSSVLFPTLVARVQGDPAGFWSLFGSGLRVATWVGIATGVLVAVGSLVALPTLFGPEYQGTASVAAVLTITLPIMFQGAVVDAYVFGFRMVWLNTVKSTVALLVKVILLFILAPRMGLLGAAASTVLAVASSLIVTSIPAPRVFRLQVLSFFPGRLVDDLRRVKDARS